MKKRATATDGRTSFEDGVFLVDRMRIWRVGGDFMAHTELESPEGCIFSVKVIGSQPHPRPKSQRRRKRIAVPGLR